MVRKVLRRPQVEQATGYPTSTLYWKIRTKKFPPGHKLDPTGQTRVWFEDEVEAWQKGEWKPTEDAA
jgi:predicted DNA-binding transcriptional regulator AlpA